MNQVVPYWKDWDIRWQRLSDFMNEFGGPEVLRLEEVTFEEPAPGELRLKVGAIGLNRREVVYHSVFQIAS